jgi:hypothetical protein
MPRFATENIAVGDQSWLGSTHALANARTETVDISAFTAGTHYPNGYIPSGFPVALVGGLLVPYDVTVGTVAGAGILAGHLATDFRVSGTADLPAAVVDHGRVKVAKIALILTGFVKPIAAKLAATIVYI